MLRTGHYCCLQHLPHLCQFNTGRDTEKIHIKMVNHKVLSLSPSALQFQYFLIKGHSRSPRFSLNFTLSILIAETTVILILCKFQLLQFCYILLGFKRGSEAEASGSSCTALLKDSQKTKLPT